MLVKIEIEQLLDNLRAVSYREDIFLYEILLITADREPFIRLSLLASSC